MSTKTEHVKFHASASGRLYIKEEEFFRSEKVKTIVHRLLNSPIYKQIKEDQSKVATSGSSD